MIVALDHLVVASASLQLGVDHVEHQLGVKLSPGGQHLFMGTHNALLRLGDACYLEVIAIDPSLPAPLRPRWFGLDDVALQVNLAKTPRLIHWVVRTDNIASAQATAADIVGPIVAASRGALKWKITIPETGSLPEGGAFPTLIQWETESHVAGAMPECGCNLTELVVRHPNAFDIAKSIRLPAAPSVRFETAATLKLFATVNTPIGLRLLV